MNKIETWCPIFPGFDNTLYEFNEEDEIYNLNCEKEKGSKDLDYDDFDYDYKGYGKDIAESFVDSFSDKLSESIPLLDKIVCQKVVSPKEYNWYNDSINIEVICKKGFEKWVKDYLKTNADKWKKYLENHYTSYDGFLSSFPNNLKGWEELTEDYTNFENGHSLGSILSFYCESEFVRDKDDESFEIEMYNDTMGDVYAGEYMTLKE